MYPGMDVSRRGGAQVDWVALNDAVHHEWIRAHNYPCAITPATNAVTQELIDISMCKIQQSRCFPRLIRSSTRNDVPKLGVCHVAREVYREMVKGRCVCEPFIIKPLVTPKLCVTHSAHHIANAWKVTPNGMIISIMLKTTNVSSWQAGSLIKYTLSHQLWVINSKIVQANPKFFKSFHPIVQMTPNGLVLKRSYLALCRGCMKGGSPIVASSCIGFF